ncbi:HEPN domain-containing protein [Butyrivibrio sp. AE3009]|uniref:HEPN domain-containing protein n=1 Tax=Butyrivibrio sp. AE3009 TaxID=1280666 RepID=UPI0003B331CA|nr:HEPN domain-containing protein [Butyrivibrio sp. AE3009]
MNADNMRALAKLRYERAKELIDEATDLLQCEHYKSANNSAFYAGEKAVKAALAAIGKDSESHNGVIKTFNKEFIHQPCDFFSRDDLRILQSMERIRNSSDYDDFYVANKAECEDQVAKARQLLCKVSAYLKTQGII